MTEGIRVTFCCVNLQRGSARNSVILTKNMIFYGRSDGSWRYCETSWLFRMTQTLCQKNVASSEQDSKALVPAPVCTVAVPHMGVVPVGPTASMRVETPYLQGRCCFFLYIVEGLESVCEALEFLIFYR